MMAGRRAIGTTGRVVDDQAIQEFAAALRGQLLRPSDNGYDAARKVFNGMIDRRPALLPRAQQSGVQGVLQEGPDDHPRRPTGHIGEVPDLQHGGLVP
jgi:hypothetical protein